MEIKGKKYRRRLPYGNPTGIKISKSRQISDCKPTDWNQIDKKNLVC
jgi:hypothetical protein